MDEIRLPKDGARPAVRSGSEYVAASEAAQLAQRAPWATSWGCYAYASSQRGAADPAGKRRTPPNPHYSQRELVLASLKLCPGAGAESTHPGTPRR